MVDTVDKVIIEYESKNFDKAAGDVKQLSGNLEGLTEVSFTAEKSTASLENKFASLERRFQTSAAQSAQYEKIQKDVNLAVANNPALQSRANDVLAAAEARYLGAGKAVTELATAHKGLDAQGQAALHSVRSVVEQLALGISPAQALTGQLNHLTFAATGEGGLVGAFKQVGGFVGGLLTPMTAAIAGTVALGAAAAALALQYDKVQVSSQRALIGAGARTGTTVSDLNSFTSQNSGISGTGLSNKEARALGEDFTKTGEIVINRLHGMSDAVVGFANQTGKSVTEASKEFVKFGEDPKKGIEELTAAFGPLSKQTRDLVETFTLAGDKTAALNVLIDATADKSKKAAENMGVLEKIWRGITTFAGTETTKPSGIENQLEGARAKLNTAISSAPDMLNTADASQNVERLSREFEKLQAAREGAIGQAATDNLNKLSTGAEQARVNVAAIAKSWGDVGAETALALNALQQQAAIAGAVTGQQQMAAKYAADFTNYSLQASTALGAGALAAESLKVSQAAATAAVLKQVEALKDQNAMIKAQQNGTEATTAAAIAYKNAIESGADATAAASLKAQTLANYMQQAGMAAQTLGEQMQNAVNSMNRFVAGQGQSLAYAQEMAARNTGAKYDANSAEAYGGPITGGRGGSQFDPSVMPKGPLTFSAAPGYGGGPNAIDVGQNVIAMLQSQAAQQAGGIAQIAGSAYSSGGIAAALAAIKKAPNTTGVSGGEASLFAMGGGGYFASGIDAKHFLGSEQSVIDEKISTYDQLTQLLNSQTTDKTAQASNLQSEMAWLQTLPASIARDEKITSLQQSIDQLKASTDGLNSTNSELLSPYYTQDPRTSHIGFRSQGMAGGGYVDVPGSPSANDNMIATIPVASGERIYVDAMPGKRGGGSSQTISVVNHITIAGNASKDEIGRTFYQLAQNQAKQLAAGAR